MGTEGDRQSTPALTEIVCLVISRMSSEARNSARFAMSSGPNQVGQALRRACRLDLRFGLKPQLALAFGEHCAGRNVLDRIRHLGRRQNDADVMLDRGDFPLLYLGSFDLDPTSAVCDKARDLLRRRVQPLASKSPNSRPYAEIAGEVAGAVAAMDWLVGYGCSCDAESLAWETMAKSYRNPNFDVVRLTELRDPENLGRALREHPARFSMLTQQAPLKAWLNFADEEGLREQVFAGARKLDHRTSDAIEMLGEDEYTAQTMLRYLPVLDLDATPQLCEAAHQVLHRQFAQIYRPKADDPRPYRELLSRLGDGAQFSALRWLAEHGCAVAAELSDAESLVRAYQDSPERAAMLATLAQLRR
jgi:hypothetical protein